MESTPNAYTIERYTAEMDAVAYIDRGAMQQDRFIEKRVDIQRHRFALAMGLNAPTVTFHVPQNGVNIGLWVFQSYGIFVDADVGLAPTNRPMVAKNLKFWSIVDSDIEVYNAVAS